ncbi:Metallo-dependent phosphatase [Punctularia strigosozonata HHB-11173 SS5]|uniref:Metallo-dependent phosphatase n=1 Tax=Punctularia strigosozonata (strain HHB-11173) TaxID=741275 RepID=UPI00044169DD|nr:Metallo-dependent phosphatase [Punctularia strigosozonata HHB-11173 SS5]EIN10902.1 Metallo-dependent phosphatase [Punctularia strigosozonata HHB-11173 SS5]
MAQRPRRLLLTPIVLLAVGIVYTLCFEPGATLVTVVQHALWPYTRDVESLPDFSRIIHHRTISHDELKLDQRHGRLITVGDIHGMNHSFHSLLGELHYDPSKDKLIHHGDFLTKGPASNAVLSWMAAHNITGVRGNQDQACLEWRSWQNWIESLQGGRKWLRSVEKRWKDARKENKDLSKTKWLRKQRKEAKGRAEQEWWDRLPKDWKPFNTHYRIARHMTEAEYEYLLSLPLILHAPSIHSFFVHGGMLPYKLLPTPPYAASQPLAHIPSHDEKADEDKLRRMQEEALLDIPENRVPWNVLNIRSVKRGRHVSRENFDGKPWSSIWNAAMKRCVGYGHLSSTDLVDAEESPSWARTTMRIFKQGPDFDIERATLPCKPSMIVYAHAATRGWDIKRWSIGTDTGCVYGQRLTAMVLGAKTKDFPTSAIEDGKRDDEDEDTDDHPAAMRVRTVKYGDSGRAHLVSVRCHLK